MTRVEVFGSMIVVVMLMDFTYFIWDNRNQDMLRKLHPVGEEYFKPKVGSLLIFPNWLKHAVMPFYGEGERRTLDPQMQTLSLQRLFDWKDASEEERQKLLHTLRGSRVSLWWRWRRSWCKDKKIDYKYNEDNILKELQEYIDKTYDQHYSHKNFQAN